MKQFAVFYLTLTLLAACNRPASHYLRHTDIQQLPPPPGEVILNNHCCDDPLSYIPDTLHPDHCPLRYIRVNFHIMDASDSSHNFRGEEARTYVRGLIEAMNKGLVNNEKLWLPPNNVLPVLPTNYRYLLYPCPYIPDDDGIYFHHDDSLYFWVTRGKDANLSSRAVINKYGIMRDTVMNIFLLPHHPDSVKSPTYHAVGTGVALGTSYKVAGLYESREPPQNFRGMMNHETAHILGLQHTWNQNDGCDDTPKHSNCWDRSAEPPCDTMASNNVMDYNAHESAWSPCQIGTIHKNIAKEHSKARGLVRPDWCESDEESSIFIRDSIDWRGAKDLDGPLFIEKGGTLHLHCRLSIPKDATITVRPGGVLILDNCRIHNACGNTWKGIVVQEKGDLKGKIIFVGEPKIENAVFSIQN